MILLGGAGVIAGAILGGLTLGFAEAIDYSSLPRFHHLSDHLHRG